MSNFIDIIIDDDSAMRITRAVEWWEGDDEEDRLWPEEQLTFTGEAEDGHVAELNVCGGDDGGVVTMMLLLDADGGEVYESNDESSPWGTWDVRDEVTGEPYSVRVIAESEL